MNQTASVNVARSSRNTLNQLPYLHARILWPALGFPEVVAPADSASAATGTDHIELLVLCSEASLTSKHVASHLRIVPWRFRHHRDFAPAPFAPGADGDVSTACSFPDAAVTVLGPLALSGKGSLTREIHLCNGHIRAGLAVYVLTFYREVGYPHLFRIVISPSCSRMVAPGLYHLFWINRPGQGTVQHMSEELRVLKERFWRGRADGYLASRPEEYEYDRGGREDRLYDHRTEVLHPLFVQKKAPADLDIGVIADPHVATTWNTFERNLRRDRRAVMRRAKKFFNNYNSRFEEIYAAAASCDIIVMLGDLIDYGRGHDGRNPLGADASYVYDRNWILFYSQLAGEDWLYKKPVFTLLGNHDWRLNPYGPINPSFTIAPDLNLTAPEIRRLHGRDSDERWYGSALAVWSTSLKTSLDSVKWYLLLINPFFDYAAALPGHFRLLALDWAENERVISIHPFATTGLPIAEDALTENQKGLVDWFCRQPEAAKVVALHPAIVGPRPEWPDSELDRGFLEKCPLCGGRGTVPGSVSSITAMPLACRCTRRSPPKQGACTIIAVDTAASSPDLDTHPDALRTTATYGTLESSRNWFIERLCTVAITDGKPVLGCAMALSGHAHRNSVFDIVRSSSGGRLPPGAARRVGPASISGGHMGVGPFFINVTCAGPMGDRKLTYGQSQKTAPGWAKVRLDSRGVIGSVDFRFASIRPRGWEVWWRKKSKAVKAWLADGGVIAAYKEEDDAEDEKECDEPWQKGGRWECWVRRHTKAREVYVSDGRIVAVFDDQEDAEEESSHSLLSSKQRLWLGDSCSDD